MYLLPFFMVVHYSRCRSWGWLVVPDVTGGVDRVTPVVVQQAFDPERRVCFARAPGSSVTSRLPWEARPPLSSGHTSDLGNVRERGGLTEAHHRTTQNADSFAVILTKRSTFRRRRQPKRQRNRVVSTLLLVLGHNWTGLDNPWYSSRPIHFNCKYVAATLIRNVNWRWGQYSSGE